MVDEREDRYEDEGEYHFSDEQINYDELEVPKAGQGVASAKASVLDKLSNVSSRRRIILAGVVFLFLIGIVYKMLAPATAPTSEIKQLGTAAQPASQKPMVSQQAIKPPVPVQSGTVQIPPPAEGVMPSQPMQQTGQPVGQQPAEQPVMIPAQGTAAPMMPPNEMPMPVAGPPPADAAAIANRLKAVEDQNGAMMSLLQTEYAQKMSDFEAQSTLARTKMDELAKRISNIEASLSQITQLLQQNAGPKSQAVMMEGPPSRMAPKVSYTVQAIIPGRAWLKTDGGDTVTVAEGDTLRGYGRISKIDPYDGVVEIDTGNKIIALSYGMSSE